MAYQSFTVEHGCRKLRMLAFAAVATSASLHMPARADESLIRYATTVPREEEADALRFTAFQVERYDSNFFRLPDDVDPNGNGRRSTVTSTTGAGVGLDKRYGQQRIVAEAAVTYDHYAPYNNLDFTGYRLTSTYYWTVTPSITGQIAFERARLPTDFEFTSLISATNPRTTQTARLDADWRAAATLHPRLSIYETEDTTQDPTFQVESYKARNVELALIYELRSNNRAQIYARTSHGNNTDNNQDSVLLLNNDFKEQEYGIRGEWNANGFVRGDFNFGRLDRSYETFSQRDFSGFVGGFGLVADITGKSSIRLSATRTLNSSQTVFSSYFEEDVGRASLDYAVTGKTIVRPVFQFRRQAYRGSPFPVATPLTYSTRDASLELQYAATRAVDLSFGLTRSARTANDRTYQFVNRSASVLARLKF